MNESKVEQGEQQKANAAPQVSSPKERQMPLGGIGFGPEKRMVESGQGMTVVGPGVTQADLVKADLVHLHRYDLTTREKLDVMDITHSASTKALGQDVAKINMAEKASKDPEYAKALNAVRPDILKGWADDRTKALVASTEKVEKFYGEKLRNYENLTANPYSAGREAGKGNSLSAQNTHQQSASPQQREGRQQGASNGQEAPQKSRARSL
jgi:hypothetical protein